MEQTKTAREILAYIEKTFFKGADLAKAILLKSEERRAYRLSQVDRLLTEKLGTSSLAIHLSDLFWTADEGRVQYDGSCPLLSLKEQQTLTDKEMGRLRLILEIAGLCHDLSLHFTFDMKEAFDVKDYWWVSNKQLVKWLTITEYEHIAMHTAYIMKKHAISVYAYGHYLPAQDELAELYSTEHNCRLDYPERTEVPPRDYVSIILDSLLAIERHWQRGRRLKLRPDLVMLHDEIYGVVPRQFDKGVLKAAQELYDYMDEKLCGRLVLKDYNYNATSWEEQPESVRRLTKVALDDFAAKVRQVRSKYLAEGWLTDNSLAFIYLIDHASRCGHGQWREEDDAL